MKYTKHLGFALPVILALSLVSITLGLASLQYVTVVRKDFTERYYEKMAEQAAEAGVVYALTCYEQNQRTQSWPGGTTLLNDDGCNGTNNPSLPQYFYSDNSVATTFSAGDVTLNGIYGAQTTAIGTAYIRSGGVNTGRTYSFTLKRSTTWSPNLQAVKSASATQRTCGLIGGDVYCWGLDDEGQLGDGSPLQNSSVPVKVKREAYPAGIGSYQVIALASGGDMNCLVIETNEVYCWGDGSNGKLGDGDSTVHNAPAPIHVGGVLAYSGGPPAIKIKEIMVGYLHVCALTDYNDPTYPGLLYCWGMDNQGQLGNGSAGAQSLPAKINGAGGYGTLSGKKVQTIASTGGFATHTCVIAESNVPTCWGYNASGQVGDNSTTKRTSPVSVNTSGVLSGKTVTAMALDGNTVSTTNYPHTCAIAYTTAIGPSDSKVYCWGDNTNGQLGNNSTTNSSVPVAVNTSGVLGSKVAKEVAISSISSCALAYPSAGDPVADVRPYCWGKNINLGNGSSSQSLVPVAVGAPLNSVASDNLSGGAQRMCARSLQKIYCWGANGLGQIGDGTTVTPRLYPTEALFLRPLNFKYIF